MIRSLSLIESLLPPAATDAFEAVTRFHRSGSSSDERKRASDALWNRIVALEGNSISITQPETRALRAVFCAMGELPTVSERLVAHGWFVEFSNEFEMRVPEQLKIAIELMADQK